MASEPDNPFARNSAWPQMPQAPFRVGPLPKADSAAPPEEPARQAVTPVFTRPTNTPPAFAGLPAGVITRPTAQPRPAAPRPVEPAAAEPPPPEPVPATEPPSPPVAPPEPYIELAPVIVQPLGSARRAAPRKSPIPAIAASAAGLAAVLGVAYALSRGQEAALKAPVTPPLAAVAAPPALAVTPTPQPAVETLAVAPPAKIAAAPRAPVRTAPPPRLVVAPPAPVVADAVASAPVISLPPPVATPAPPPQPAYTPPAAPDPAAPMTTRRD